MADRTVRVLLVAEVNQFIAKTQAAKASLADFGTTAMKTSKTHSQGWQTMTRASAVGAGALAFAVGEAVKSNMDFERSMSAVGAVANTNGSQLELLRQVALKAGKDTMFSATQAAQGEEELAKAGLSVAQIAGGALTGALNLAAAGTISVASAAETTATALSQFGLNGSQASHVADLLSAAANKAQGGVSDMAEALKFVGPVAHQMGIGIEETTGTIAELASKGILGSMAGESLRGMLISMTSPSKLAAKTMKELGINVYDATGNFVGFEGVAGQLQDRMGNLTAAQRDFAFGQMFGNAQITTARILYEGGAQGVKRWTDQVNDSGNAARTAAAKTDNLAGDLERLRGSLETALIQSGSGANTSLRNLSKSAEGAVNAFAGLPAPVQQGSVWLAAIGSAGLGAVSAFGFLAPKVQASRAALEAMGPTGVKANAALGRIGTAAFKAGAAFAAFEIASQAIGAGVDALTKDAPGVQAMTKALIEMQYAGKGSGTAMAVFGSNLDNLGTQVNNASSGSEKFLGHFGLMSQSAKQASGNFESLDQAMAGLVAGGHADIAAEQFARLKDATQAQYVASNGFTGSVKDLKGLLPGYAEALAKVNNDARLAGAGTGQLKLKVGELNAALVQLPDGKWVKISTPGVHQSEADIRSLHNQIDHMPDHASTSVTTPGARKAELEIRSLHNWLEHLPTYKSVRVVTDVITSHHDSYASGRAVTTRIPKSAAGGPVQGPGTATSDDVLMWGSNGEWMMQASARQKYGDAFMSAVNEGRLAAGGPVGSPAVIPAAAGGTTISIANLTLPNVRNPQQFIQELRNFARDNGGNLGLADVI